MLKTPPRINVKPEDADGEYSNMAIVTFSRAEFVLDFARVMPGVPNASLKARVIVSPQRIKSVVSALESQIRAYEQKYGKLEEADGQAPIGFQNPSPGASEDQ
ncbi:DUF3467 domain-containing protein [Candidatus Fermentibacteria bacterium]|nr:DUF3467 domain-containing protein [Candidatus Fermentibacteria bacterium]